MVHAAIGRDVATLQFIMLGVLTRDQWIPDALDLATAEGHLHIVRFLTETYHCPATTSAMDDAAWKGHLEVVRYLHAHRA